MVNEKYKQLLNEYQPSPQDLTIEEPPCKFMTRRKNEITSK